jgi:uncharacterized MAPEG superfamily protein
LLKKSGLALRIERTARNRVEAAAYVVPSLGGAALMGPSGPGVQTAAMLVVLARAAFCGLYYTGIPVIRVLGFLTVSLSQL